MKKLGKIVVIAFAVMVLFSACGGGNDNSPLGTAKSFMSNLAKGNFSKAASYATEEAGVFLKSLDGSGIEENLSALKFKYTEVSVSDTSAVVSIDNGSDPIELPLSKIDGTWKVDLSMDMLLGKM